MQQTVLPIVVLGFLLGMKHALDVDHLAAVTTLLAGHRDRWRSVLVGIWWGLGHSASLLLLGGAIIVFGIAFPPAVSLALEFCVGLMLIALGARVLLRLRKGEALHLHLHEHAGRIHVHPHLHPTVAAARHSGDEAAPSHHGVVVPVVRTPKTSLLVGLAHGAAGSAGLTLLLLPTMPTKTMGVLYLCVFAAGSILGMSLATLLLSLPLGMLGMPGTGRRGDKLASILAGLAGGFGVGVGLIMAVQTGGELLHL